MLFEDFKRVHEVPLLSAGLPTHLYSRLFQKLSEEKFDAGEYVRIEEVEGGRRRLVLAADTLGKEEDVFLIDHAWSFRLPQAREQLNALPSLVDRLAVMMGVADVADGSDDVVDTDKGECEGQVEPSQSISERVAAAKGSRWLDLEGQAITDDQLAGLQLAVHCPDIEGLDLSANALCDPQIFLSSLSGLSSLRAVWVNGNPLQQEIEDDMRSLLTHLEVLNGRFTSAYGLWALLRYSDADPEGEGSWEERVREVKEMELGGRGMQKLKQEVFSAARLPALQTLNLCGNPLAENTPEELAAILAALPSLRHLSVDVPGPLGSNPADIIQSLPSLTTLNLSPTSALPPRLPAPPTPGEPPLERVLRAMWHYVQTYRLATEDQLDETAVWYVMDEVGSALRHSDAPAVAVAPFLHMPGGTLESAVSYSLMWPTQALTRGQELSRNFLVGVGEDKQRSARLTAWFHTPTAFFEEAYVEHWKVVLAGQEGLPAAGTHPGGVSSQPLVPASGSGGKLRVFSDLPPVHDLLTSPQFTLVDDVASADILFCSAQMDEEWKEAAGVRSDQVLNQFPFEACLVMKHHLAATVRQVYGNPPWIQPTYDLESQLAPMIGDYNRRQKAAESGRNGRKGPNAPNGPTTQNEQNGPNGQNGQNAQHGHNGQNGRQNSAEGALWILKPWNMARSLDSSVTSHLPQILRTLETGPKICQKYIERPALFRGKKFDLRFLVLVRRFRPLEAFVHKVFWSRIATKDYTADPSSLNDFETHFTVMNYVGKPFSHVPTHEFVEEFEREHNVKWEDIQSRVYAMIKKVFQAAAVAQPQIHSDQSRAIYGVDVMLEEGMQPKLLEVTYCPDCTRGSKYDMKEVTGPGKGRWVRGKDLYNTVFQCLFLNESVDVDALE